MITTYDFYAILAPPVLENGSKASVPFISGSCHFPGLLSPENGVLFSLSQSLLRTSMLRSEMSPRTTTRSPSPSTCYHALPPCLIGLDCLLDYPVPSPAPEFSWKLLIKPRWKTRTPSSVPWASYLRNHTDTGRCFSSRPSPVSVPATCLLHQETTLNINHLREHRREWVESSLGSMLC